MEPEPKSGAASDPRRRGLRRPHTMGDVQLIHAAVSGAAFSSERGRAPVAPRRALTAAAHRSHGVSAPVSPSPPLAARECRCDATPRGALGREQEGYDYRGLYVCVRLCVCAK